MLRVIATTNVMVCLNKVNSFVFIKDMVFVRCDLQSEV